MHLVQGDSCEGTVLKLGTGGQGAPRSGGALALWWDFGHQEIALSLYSWTCQRKYCCIVFETLGMPKSCLLCGI